MSMHRPSGCFCTEDCRLQGRNTLLRPGQRIASPNRACRLSGLRRCKERRQPPPWLQQDIQAAAAPVQQAGAGVLRWHVRNPLQLQGSAKAARISSMAVLPGWQRLQSILHAILQFLIQPPGGQPVGVIEALPGWQVKLARGPRRWLGLRPGRAVPVVDPGPFWTPSGLLHLVQSVPTGVWLLLCIWLATALVKGFLQHRKAQLQCREQEKVGSAGRLQNLKYQRQRMLRDLGERVETPVEEPPPEPAWQDPSEWDTATRRQWDEFMRKSKALRIHEDSWWDITSADDEPAHKKAYDKIKRSGVNQDDYRGKYLP